MTFKVQNLTVTRYLLQEHANLCRCGLESMLQMIKNLLLLTLACIAQFKCHWEMRTLLSVKIWNSCYSGSSVTVLHRHVVNIFSFLLHFLHSKHWKMYKKILSSALGWHLLNSHLKHGILFPALYITCMESQVLVCILRPLLASVTLYDCRWEWYLFCISVPPGRPNWKQFLPYRGHSLK